MDDVRAVMDAAESERAALFGSSEGGLMSMLFAATYPDRTRALVTHAIYAKRLWSADYSVGADAGSTLGRDRADGAIVGRRDGHLDAGAERRRGVQAPGGRAISDGAPAPVQPCALLRMNSQIDVRAALPTISVPTLVLHRVGDIDVNVEEARWIASEIPGAKLVELPGDDHLIWSGDVDGLADEVEDFLTGQPPRA